ncbi:MAG TPA: hypothetical protein VFV38_19180 [Ktedonobacteraceae bacterium]|nr:hypothetical protein [Ktedonobacteraceae bacterium]
MIEQVDNGRGHRQRIYCHKNCCMAAIRERKRLAALEADRQQRLELMRLEKEALRKRFNGLSAESIDVLYQIKYDGGLQNQVGKALVAERFTPVPPQEKSLMEANVISWGHKLNFPALQAEGIDIPEGLSGWWHYAHYTPLEVLEHFFIVVRRLVQERETALKATA